MRACGVDKNMVRNMGRYGSEPYDWLSPPAGDRVENKKEIILINNEQSILKSLCIL